MKVKTDFKQMVLVDHILYNKLNSITKPDVHIQQVRTPNSFPTNSIHPPNPTYSAPSIAPTTAQKIAPSTAPTTTQTIAPSIAPTTVPTIAPPIAPTTTPSTVPISEPSHPNTLHIPNNEWEKQAHQWIDTFQQPNYMNYMDTSAQMEDSTNAAQSESVEYTNTPQRGVIQKITSPYITATALPQRSVEQQMEIEYNQTPSIANEIKKAVDQEKRLHIEYAPPLPSINSNSLSLMQKPQKETQMEVVYSNPLTPMTISTLDPTPRALPSLPAPAAPLSLAAPATFRSLPAPATFRSLPAPPTVPSLPAPPTIRSLPAPPTVPSLPAPLSLTHVPTPVRDFSKNEECDECAKPVEYKKKLPITFETNASKAMVPYNNYVSMSTTPGEKQVFYTCTRCNTNFTKERSLINHNKRFHAAFEQTEKGHKRKPKGEVMPYGVPLLKQQKARGVKRRYEQNTGSNKEIVPYKPYVLEKTT